MTSPSLEADWQPLVSTIAAMVTLAPEHVVVQVHSDDGPNGGPYVQTLCEEDGAMTLEAASNVFLDQKLSHEAIELLQSMGWSEPEPDIGLPNHHCMVSADSAAPGDIAEFLVRTLRDVYGVTTSAVFEMAPYDLFVSVLNGEYGVETGMQFYQDDSDPRDAD